MNRLEEIKKQIAELEAERQDLLTDSRNIEPKLERYYQEALKLKGKYIKWTIDESVTRLAKVADVSKEGQVGLELTKFFMLGSDGTFFSDNYEFEKYASYVSSTGMVEFRGRKFKVIDESEYLEFIHNAVDKFCSEK